MFIGKYYVNELLYASHDMLQKCTAIFSRDQGFDALLGSLVSRAGKMSMLDNNHAHSLHRIRLCKFTRKPITELRKIHCCLFFSFSNIPYYHNCNNSSKLFSSYCHDLKIRFFAGLLVCEKYSKP